MKSLYIHIETCSAIYRGVGIHQHRAADGFSVRMVTWQTDSDPLHQLDCMSAYDVIEQAKLVQLLQQPDVEIVTLHAGWVKPALEEWIGIQLHYDQWVDLSSYTRLLSLPTQLADLCGLVGVSPIAETPWYHDGTKQYEHHKMITSLSEQGAQYVHLYQKLWHMIRKREIDHIPQMEPRLMCHTLRLNERGVRIDNRLATTLHTAVEYYSIEINRQMAEILECTVDALSREAVRHYVEEQCGAKCQSTRIEDLRRHVSMHAEKIPDDKRGTLFILLWLYGLSSSTIGLRLDTLHRNVVHSGTDYRIYDNYVYCGTKSGRWSSIRVQLHNLPKSSIIDTERRSVLQLCQKPNSSFKDIRRIAIRAKDLFRSLLLPDGDSLTVCDYCQMEARVLAALSLSYDKLNIIVNGNIYEHLARRIFGKTVVNSEEIRCAKLCELSLGYGAGANAIRPSLEMNSSPLTAEEVIALWREINHNIITLWHDVEQAFRSCATTDQEVSLNGGLSIIGMSDPWYDQERCVAIVLPGGRRIYYRHITTNNDGVYYRQDGLHPEAVHGYLLVSHIVQGVARDILGDKLLLIEEKLFDTVLHVHDEIAVEGAEVGDEYLKTLLTSSLYSKSWYRNIPLQVHCQHSDRYL